MFANLTVDFNEEGGGQMVLTKKLEKTLLDFKRDVITLGEAKKDLLELHRQAVKRMFLHHVEQVLKLEAVA